ncbi:MAG: spore coat protein CotH [Paenibacillaceae bacterium]|jgi:hypothetical protein|nr:spore coat protein CotH [Paenibacillaceae bacterium]
MKSKSAVPVLVGMFTLMLIAGLIGYSLRSGTTAAATLNPAVSAAPETIAENVFPKDKVIDVKITIDEADFQDMLDNASLEEYKTASVEYNGVKLNNIGIRTKGNLSLRSVVQMPDSDRYSFKLSFDEYVSDQTLNGISKINLNNNYSDASSMREFMTYELAEKMGLPTPGYSYVNVYVNDKLWGFYLSVEQVDAAYLERNFGNSYGALYKGEMTGTGSDLAWLGEDITAYTGLAQKSESSNEDILIDMLNELNNGTDYESVLDVDNVLQYIALNAATANMDSYLGSNKQNYYLYEDEGIFSILPWDYNMAFGGMGGGMGGMGGGGSGTSVLIDEPTQGAVAERPLIAKLLAVDTYKERYHEILKEIVEGYMSDESFARRAEEISAMISPYVEQDPRPFYSYEEYQQGVTQLVTVAANLKESITGQLDGTVASTNNGNGSGGGMGGGRGGMGAAGGGREGRGGMGAVDGGVGAGIGAPGGMGAGGMRGGMGMPENGQQTVQTQSSQDGQQAAPAQNGQGAQQTAPAQNGQGAQQAAPAQNGQGAQQAAPAQNGQGAQQAAPAQNGQGVQQAAPAQNGQGAQQAAPAQNGQTFPANGEMPAFGGDRQGGFGGMGGMGQPGEQLTAAAAQGSTKEAATSAILCAVLLLACLFVVFYKRHR